MNQIVVENENENPFIENEIENHLVVENENDNENRFVIENENENPFYCK